MKLFFWLIVSLFLVAGNTQAIPEKSEKKAGFTAVKEPSGRRIKAEGEENLQNTTWLERLKSKLDSLAKRLKDRPPSAK